MPRNEKRLSQWLEGQERANRLADAEVVETLSHMTRAERLAQFEDLCGLFRSRVRRRQRDFDRIKRAELLELRRRLRPTSEAVRRE